MVVSEWSQEEITASVQAYLEMLQQEILGIKYNKAAVNRDLREGVLSERSRGSIEMRMCNISTVLRDYGKCFIEGYKPRENVGANVYLMISQALDEYSGKKSNTPESPTETPAADLKQNPIYHGPTSDSEELDRRVEEIRKNELLGFPPSGNKKPRKQILSETEVVERDPQVKRWVLDSANGICELCDNPAPFLSKSPGHRPYLEVHHVVPLKMDGSDTVCNAVALCPNCHMQCHHSQDFQEVTRSLYQKIERLIVP